MEIHTPRTMQFNAAAYPFTDSGLDAQSCNPSMRSATSATSAALQFGWNSNQWREIVEPLRSAHWYGRNQHPTVLDTEYGTRMHLLLLTSSPHYANMEPCAHLSLRCSLLSLFLTRSLSFSRVQKTAGEHHGERVDISDCKWVWSCAELQMCQRYLSLVG